MTNVNYYLGNTDDTKMYRIVLDEVAVGPEFTTYTYTFVEARMMGLSQPLPDGSTFSGFDVPADIEMVLMDMVLGNVGRGRELSDYRTLAEDVLDAEWT